MYVRATGWNTKKWKKIAFNHKPKFLSDQYPRVTKSVTTNVTNYTDIFYVHSSVLVTSSDMLWHMTYQLVYDYSSCTPDDWCKTHPKHVAILQWNKEYILRTAASRLKPTYIHLRTWTNCSAVLSAAVYRPYGADTVIYMAQLIYANEHDTTFSMAY
jgi:hypothetical protein